MNRVIYFLVTIFCFSCESSELEKTKKVASPLNSNGIDTTVTKSSPWGDCTLGVLLRQVESMEVMYAAFSCPCAQWINLRDADSMDSDHAFYLQQGREGILNADTLFDGMNLPLRLRIKGQFYSGVGMPSRRNLDKGQQLSRVFRYYEAQVVKSPN